MVDELLVIIVAGAVVWLAGTQLSRDADALAATTGLGRVFVGAVLLGFATSLPEIATTVSAGLAGNAGLATGNLMGGVALQVVVLAVADVIESRQGLTFQVSKPSVLVQHVVLLLLLSVAIAGMTVGEPFEVAGVGAWPVALVALYIGGLRLISKAEGHTGWSVTGTRPRLGHDAGGARGVGAAGDDDDDEGVVRPPLWRLAVLGGLILVAGWAVARAGDSLSGSSLLSGTFVGAALVAVATSLPELSTVIGSLRAGSYDMAVANIVGTNGMEVALLLLADIAYREGALLDRAGTGDIFLAALAAVLTCTYLCGLLVRRERTVLRVGWDSAAVLVLYAGGLAVLALVS